MVRILADGGGALRVNSARWPFLPPVRRRGRVARRYRRACRLVMVTAYALEFRPQSVSWYRLGWYQILPFSSTFSDVMDRRARSLGPASPSAAERTGGAR